MVIKKTSRTYLIDDLEKINQVIDLCIDRELYKELDQIIKLNEFANKFFEEFIAGDNSEDRFAKSFEGLPVTELILPIKLADHLRIKNRKITLQWSETNDDQLFKYWSYLFWAKKYEQKYNVIIKPNGTNYLITLSFFLKTTFLHLILSRLKSRSDPSES